jgi:predicted MFS family arabinose efflux permease
VSTLAPMRHRPFRLLVSGQLASNVGDAFYAVALPWYVLASHGGPILLGTVLAAYGIPRTLLVAVGGHASDKWHPWNVMMAADAVRTLAVAGLGVAALQGRASAAVLVPIAVVIGAGEGIFLPGSMAIVPELVPDDDLQAANALASGGFQISMLAGPALGGLLVALSGPAAAFLFDAATFAISAATLAGIRRSRSHAEVQHEEVLADVPAGAESGTKAPVSLGAFVRAQRWLQVLLLVAVAANLGSGGLGEVALPSLARGPFHTGAAGYGGLIAAVAAGALVGTLVAGRLATPARPAMVASAAFILEAGFVAVVPYLGSPIPAGVALAVFGGLNGFGNILTITTFQRWAPPELLGRLMGLVVLASMGIFPVSVALGGLVVRDLGPAPFFPLAGAVLAVAVLAGLTQRSWRTFGMRADLDDEAGLRQSLGSP